MIKKLTLRNFILTEQNSDLNKVLDDMIASPKDKWFESNGQYYRILEVTKDPFNLLDSKITIETWHTRDFTPYHSMAYANMTIAIQKAKEDFFKNK